MLNSQYLLVVTLLRLLRRKKGIVGFWKLREISEWSSAHEKNLKNFIWDVYVFLRNKRNNVTTNKQ